MASVSSILRYSLSPSWFCLQQTGGITLGSPAALSLGPPASPILQGSAEHRFLRMASWTPKSKSTWAPARAQAILLCSYPCLCLPSRLELCRGLPHLARCLVQNRCLTDNTRCLVQEGGFQKTGPGRGQPAAVLTTVPWLRWMSGHQALTSNSSWFTRRVDIGDHFLCSLSQDELHGPKKETFSVVPRAESASKRSKLNFP